MSLEETFEKAAKHSIAIDFKLTASCYVIELAADVPGGPLLGGTTYAPRTSPICTIAEILATKVHDIVAVATVARNRPKKVTARG